MSWRLPWSPRARPETLAQLAGVPFFADLPPASLRRLAAKCRPREFAAGQLVLREGDTGLGLFLITSGAVEVFKVDQTDGEEVPIARLGPGQVLGEMALLDDQPRSASARALEACHCLLLTRESYRSLVRRDPELAWCMVPTLVERLRDLQRLYIEAEQDLGQAPSAGQESERTEVAAQAPPPEASRGPRSAPAASRSPGGAETLLRLPLALAGTGLLGARESMSLIEGFLDQLREETDEAEGRGRALPVGLLHAGRDALDQSGGAAERLAEEFLSRLRPGMER